MKRFLMVIALCVMTFWSSADSIARGFGVTVGASSMNFDEVKAGSFANYHAGLTYKFDLPLGFAIQPSVQYHLRGSVVEEEITNKTPLDYQNGYDEVPVSLQWGPDLILFRPYFDVTPFVGYNIINPISKDTIIDDALDIYNNKTWDGLDRLQYGVGVGFGVELWKLQIVGRYNWGFGTLIDAEGNLPDKDGIISDIQNTVMTGKDYSGVTLSVSFLF
jgi:hypothetical protein